MNFSRQWNDIYQNNAHISVWPWSEVVSLISRHARPSSNDYSVLELGCGAGANIPFFKKSGANYYAIEGSAFMVSRLKETFPEYSENIIAADFTEKIPFPGPFDVILDRGSLTCNSTAAIKNCIGLLKNLLKENGKFIGIDWISTKHSDFLKGDAGCDAYTRFNYKDGQFSGIGNIHFSDRTHIEELFAAFSIEFLEHKTLRRDIPAANHTLAYWNIVASPA